MTPPETWELKSMEGEVSGLLEIGKHCGVHWEGLALAHAQPCEGEPVTQILEGGSRHTQKRRGLCQKTDEGFSMVAPGYTLTRQRVL